jgi:exodeoxyribonuclease VII small subunit
MNKMAVIDRGENMAQQPSFEESLSKLETIVEKMESGDLKLEDSLKLFEEGMKLTKDCNLRLNEIEKKVKQLLKNASAKDEGRSAKSKDE